MRGDRPDQAETVSWSLQRLPRGRRFRFDGLQATHRWRDDILKHNGNYQSR